MAHPEEFANGLHLPVPRKRSKMHFYAKKAPNIPTVGFRHFRICAIIVPSMRKMTCHSRSQVGRRQSRKAAAGQARRYPNPNPTKDTPMIRNGKRARLPFEFRDERDNMLL